MTKLFGCLSPSPLKDGICCVKTTCPTPCTHCDCEEKVRRAGKEDTVKCVQVETETVVPEAPVRRSTRNAFYRATERLKRLVEDNDSEID